jgi:hypothetical protein
MASFHAKPFDPTQSWAKTASHRNSSCSISTLKILAAKLATHNRLLKNFVCQASLVDRRIPHLQSKLCKRQNTKVEYKSRIY